MLKQLDPNKIGPVNWFVPAIEFVMNKLFNFGLITVDHLKGGIILIDLNLGCYGQNSKPGMWFHSLKILHTNNRYYVCTNLKGHLSSDHLSCELNKLQPSKMAALTLFGHCVPKTWFPY